MEVKWIICHLTSYFLCRTALDMAKKFKQTETLELLEAHMWVIIGLFQKLNAHPLKETWESHNFYTHFLFLKHTEVCQRELCRSLLCSGSFFTKLCSKSWYQHAHCNTQKPCIARTQYSRRAFTKVIETNLISFVLFCFLFCFVLFCFFWFGITSWFNSLFFFFFIWHLSAATQSNPTNDIDLEKQHSAEISEEDKELLQAYHHSFDDERVDLNLIVALLTYICDNSQEGEVSSLLKGALDKCSIYLSICRAVIDVHFYWYIIDKKWYWYKFYLSTHVNARRS